jgi:hypothetical protein
LGRNEGIETILKKIIDEQFYRLNQYGGSFNKIEKRKIANEITLLTLYQIRVRKNSPNDYLIYH